MKRPWVKVFPFIVVIILSVVALVLPKQPVQAVGGAERIAYYGNWDMYGNAYYLKHVDKSGAAANLTTLVYSFENIHPTTLECFQDIHAVDNSATSESNPNVGDGGADAWADYQVPVAANNAVSGNADSPTQPLRGNFNQLKQLKAKYPHLKVLLSIGGWTFSKYFSDAAATPASRANFVSSCVDMYIRGNLPTGVAGDTTAGGPGVAAGIFDGIDIDWEFPGSTNGHVGNHTSPSDGANYTALLAEFRSQLNAQGTVDGKHYLLTAAVPSGGSDIAHIQVPQILPYLDWAGIMSYDMHGAWEGSGPTNFQGPLYPSAGDPAAASQFTVDQAVQRWETAGFPANKLTVGIPFYWRGWSGVAAGANHGLYQPATGASPSYPYSGQAGTAHYKELLLAGKLSTANTFWDPLSQSPWIYDGSNFYTGDTPASAAKKGNYIRSQGLRGAMIYALESDDSSGTMIKSVSSGLNGGGPLPLPSATQITQMNRVAQSSANSAINAEPINMIGGNYLADRHELQLPNKDNPADFAISYNSAAGNIGGPVGWGWNHSYHITALTDSDDSVIIQNPDGRLDRFTPDGSGGYTPPSGSFDSLTVSGGLFKVTHKDRSVYNFNAKGQIASIVSANGNTQTLSYDANDYLTTITDSAGRHLTIGYNDAGQLATVTDPAGRVVTYTYDPIGNLIAVKNPENQTTSYQYDPDHRVTKVIDPRGHDVVVNVYDSEGRVTSQTNALGQTVTLAYAAGQTTYTDALGGHTIYSYDSQLRLTSLQDPLGHTTTTAYDAPGNPSLVTDALGRATARAYDARGNLTTVTDAAGNIQSFTYDTADNLLTRTDPLSHTTTYTYDTAGNVKQKTDPTGALTQFTYDSTGQLTAVTDSLNNLTGFVYDANGNQVTATDPSNRNTYYGYDSIGRLTATETMDNDETTYDLDAMDRVTKVTSPSGSQTTLTYDADGNKTQATDANGHTTTYEYDANNQLTKATNALGKATQYAYDANGKLTTKTDAKGRVTTYTYDAAGRQTTTTDPLGNVTQLAYDAADNLTSRTDASNRVTTYAYDNLDRLVTTTYPDATTATNTYNTVGDLLTATSPAGTTTYTYDAAGRVLTAKDPHNATVTYTYNSNGALTQLKYPDNKTVTYTYTPSGQLSTAKDWNNAQTTYLYDNEGRLASRALSNTIKGTYAYDVNGGLESLVYKKGTAALTRYNYTRDAIGNVTEEEEVKANGTHLYNDYTYDAADQLTMNDAPAHTYNYTYDEVGNMSTSVLDGTTSTYSYNAGNQLTAKTNTTRSFTYDPQGNQITDTGKTLTYNYDNQLKTYTSGSLATSYVYDATGNRIDKTQTGTGATNYQYVNTGDNNVLVAKNLTAGTNSFNVYGADLISQGDTAASSRQYYLPDGLGNVRLLTNSSGTTLNTYTYDPYGKSTLSGSTANNYAFQTEQKDAESSLVYLRARSYDPTTGRFTSQDPLSGSRENPASQNGYNYANNDPINLADPSGLAAQSGYNPSLGQQFLDYFGISKIQGDAKLCNWGSLTLSVLATSDMIGGNLPVGGGIGKIAKADQAAQKGSALVKAGLRFYDHAQDQMAARGVSESMVTTTIRKGQAFYDPLNNAINYIIPGGFASGKSLLVGTDALTGEVKTVIRSSKNLVKNRMIPIQ